MPPVPIMQPQQPLPPRSDRGQRPGPGSQVQPPPPPPPGYSHRSLGPPGSVPQPPSSQRLYEVFDIFRQELDSYCSGTERERMQSMASTHLNEISSLRHSFIELEREHKQLKDQYEAEIGRLNRELASHSGHPPQPPPPNLPPPKVGHGPSNLFGGLMGVQPPNPSDYPVQPPPPPSGDRSAYAGNGWEAGHGPSYGEGDQPAKRVRMEEGLAGRPDVGYPHPPTSSMSMRGAPHPYDRPPPTSRYAQAQQAANARGASPIVERPPPHTPNSANMVDMDPDNLPRELKKEGTDWVTMYNPKVRRVLDVELVHTLQHDSVVCCVKFSPDGKTLATGCNHNTNLYDTKTGAKQGVLFDDTTRMEQDNYVRSACFSPDGKLIATGSEDRSIRIWDVARKRIRHTLHGHKSEIYTLAFSPDGRRLFSGSGDRTSRIWDVDSGNHVLTLSIDEAPVADGAPPLDAGITSVAVSPDGAYLAAGSLDTVVRIWDARSGQPLDRLRGHKDSVYSVAFSPDGKWLVSGSLDKTLKIWDVAALRSKREGQEVPEEGWCPCLTTLTGHKDYVLSVAVSPDGNWIVSGSKDRGVSFWDPKSASATVVLQGHKNSVISIAVSDVGGLLATGSGDWSCRVWKMDRLD